MHDEVSETENIRKNLSIERHIVGGCEELLDVKQVFIRQGLCPFLSPGQTRKHCCGKKICFYSRFQVTFHCNIPNFVAKFGSSACDL